MLKQANNSTVFLGRIASWVAPLLFYSFVFFAIASEKLPEIPEQSFLLQKYLFENETRFFPSQEDSFKLFAPYLPKNGSISFIMDSSYNHYGKDFSWLYAAQNYLAPLILNPYSNESHALFYCSTNSIAATRLNETGYQMKALLAEGKGLALKKI